VDVDASGWRGWSGHPDSVCPLSIVDVGGCVRREEREREGDEMGTSSFPDSTPASRSRSVVCVTAAMYKTRNPRE
jgi:hypothetical protein